MKNETLKNKFGLEYDQSGYDTSLINWYNRLVDKTVEELNLADVSKMIRQNILKSIAIDRAIDLFIVDPFDGETRDGQLLSLLVSQSEDVTKSKRIQELNEIVLTLEEKIQQFDWDSEEDRSLFEKNLEKLKLAISKPFK